MQSQNELLDRRLPGAHTSDQRDPLPGRDAKAHIRQRVDLLRAIAERDILELNATLEARAAHVLLPRRTLLGQVHDPVDGRECRLTVVETGNQPRNLR